MISIIIPTFNEEENIAETIDQVRKRDPGHYAIEIIVSDGHSTDRTREIAAKAGATVVVSQKKGRSAQMNFGASIATEEILYFLHADSIPPKEFARYISNALNKHFVSGCFRLSFDYHHWFLKAAAVLVFVVQMLFPMHELIRKFFCSI